MRQGVGRRSNAAEGRPYGIPTFAHGLFHSPDNRTSFKHVRDVAEKRSGGSIHFHIVPCVKLGNTQSMAILFAEERRKER